MALHCDHISLPGSTVDLESTGLNASLAPDFSGELQPGDVICGIADVSVTSNWRDGVDRETCQDAQWINTDEAFTSISARAPAGDASVSALVNLRCCHARCVLLAFVPIALCWACGLTYVSYTYLHFPGVGPVMADHGCCNG